MGAFLLEHKFDHTTRTIFIVQCVLINEAHGSPEQRCFFVLRPQFYPRYRIR
jgi:hypothetical protein